MKKQPEVTDATREAFISAFFKLADIKNIHKISIREITNLAGYNRTTFYRYFKDVFSLMEYAEDEFFRSTRKTLTEQHKGGNTYDRQFFEAFINCFRKNPDKISILMSEQNRSHFIRRMRENVTDNLGSQIADTPKKRVVTNMFFFGVFSAIAINLQNTETLSNDDLLDIIQKLFNDWYWPQVTAEP
ncbi:MAG: TetR/AcrR family transcriptional regulator [Clostridiales bacterium]|nr:TetR/AcrR family transcriptional regulator [Clostridiales bacterium]